MHDYQDIRQMKGDPRDFDNDVWDSKFVGDFPKKQPLRKFKKVKKNFSPKDEE